MLGAAPASSSHASLKQQALVLTCELICTVHGVRGPSSGRCTRFIGDMYELACQVR